MSGVKLTGTPADSKRDLIAKVLSLFRPSISPIVTGLRFPFGFFQPLPFSLGPLLFLAGLAITVAGALRTGPGRAGKRHGEGARINARFIEYLGAPMGGAEKRQIGEWHVRQRL